MGYPVERYMAFGHEEAKRTDKWEEVSLRWPIPRHISKTFVCFYPSLARPSVFRKQARCSSTTAISSPSGIACLQSGPHAKAFEIRLWFGEGLGMEHTLGSNDSVVGLSKSWKKSIHRRFLKLNKNLANHTVMVAIARRINSCIFTSTRKCWKTRTKTGLCFR